ncbi:MAG: MFS transporter [Gammaproteobacteria bacterium RIFCSPLOWO2_02_FULL_38_11]|nr:MAG: MFS transporter [Gammaproteobacteria bacterium RIFCSPHIGHO2_12_38_15]OGT68027.1 MAG: MFS transporter [Gammaproteobacteria bacterium RIFCSPLOWO2_02_FULL_38_11]OGT76664.1 MAG: MFS transporter [Gammaproteobacteria bacterium RIFCSPLOWO2_12_FULL_38_14]
MIHEKGSYYLPSPSYWPIFGSCALFCIMFGAAHWLHGVNWGPPLFFVGLALLFFVMYGWFHHVIQESLAGLYNKQVDHSYRWGMAWFIFSEVMFFGAFFGALFYSRISAVAELAGDSTSLFGASALTHYLIWPGFMPHWPLLHNPDPSLFPAPKQVMEAWGIPALNTLILLSSGGTITWAHWGMIKNKRSHVLIGLLLTVLLGITFLCFQAHEYITAYEDYNLRLTSGIYGTTFFMLTGFHGLHVTIGTIMLIVILFRAYLNHFNSEHHFAFEAVSWYWHFVDVVWLFLFVFVYWL